MLGFNAWAAELARLIACKEDDPAGLFSITFKHVSCLVRDQMTGAQTRASFGPRRRSIRVPARSRPPRNSQRVKVQGERAPQWFFVRVEPLPRRRSRKRSCNPR